MLKLKQKIFTIIFAFISLLGLTLWVGPNNANQQVKKIEPVQERAVKRYAATSTEGLHDFYHEIADDVEARVEAGELDDFHLKYHKVEYYQMQYEQYRHSESGRAYWAGLAEEDVTWAMDMIASSQKDAVIVMKNLQMPISSLKRNQALGMYFDGIFLNFVWTSEYLPIETYNLQSITLNGITYNQQLNEGYCSHLEGDGMFECSTFYQSGPNNIQVNLTPIGGYHYCSIDKKVYEYGIGLNTNKYEITGFEANYDSVLNGLNPGEEDEEFGTEYKIVSDDAKTFTFSQKPEYEQNAMMQLSSHCYIEITDVECQTTFGINFGGYQHAVFFNTPLDLDEVYRVDVSYNLASDNKPWYNFIAAEGSMDVVKSLTPATASGGFLGLSTYQGLKEGTFKSNVDDSKTYQYQLHLNYDAGGWNLFKGGQDESKYTNVHDFKILRMNFLYKGQEIDCEVKMDEIEGDTLSLFDKNVILDVETPIWQFKETVKDVEEGTSNVIDGVKDFFEDVKEGDSKVMNTIYIVLGTVGAILLGYLIYKIVVIAKKLISNK